MNWKIARGIEHGEWATKKRFFSWLLGSQAAMENYVGYKEMAYLW
jgi:hypothetical protein